MKMVPLTQGKVALVDDEDFERVSRYKWFAYRAHTGRFYACRTVNVNKRVKHRMPLQVEVMQVPRGTIVDHRNSDPLDNRKVNLRVCSNQQNCCNRPAVGGSSGFKGVSYHKVTGKWQASIRSGERQLYLGVFSTEEEAARVYDEAAKRLHGDFARLNFDSEAA